MAVELSRVRGPTGGLGERSHPGGAGCEKWPGERGQRARRRENREAGPRPQSRSAGGPGSPTGPAWALAGDRPVRSALGSSEPAG